MAYARSAMLDGLRGARWRDVDDLANRVASIFEQLDHNDHALPTRFAMALVSAAEELAESDRQLELEAKVAKTGSASS